MEGLEGEYLTGGISVLKVEGPIFITIVVTIVEAGIPKETDYYFVNLSSYDHRSVEGELGPTMETLLPEEKFRRDVDNARKF